MLRRLAFLASLAAGCGGEGSWQRCGSSAECPAGTFCNAPVSGQDGVCQAPASAAITAPGPGAYVGASASIAATLTFALDGVQAPAGVALRLGGTPVATLALQGQPAGQVATYAGTWNPGAGQDGPGSLDVVASLAVGGATVSVASPPVAVTVDTAPPSIQAAAASCAGGCKRDSVLQVSADVTDASVVQVIVTLDVDPALSVGVTRVGNTWSASVPLRDRPFPYFQRTVQVTVRATDLALNEASTTLPVDVTRLRWAYSSGATAVTSPAVMSDGTIVFGVSATSGQLRALRPDMTEAFPPVTLGSQAVTASPTIGPTAIWVASNDGKVYAVALDGSGILNGSGCDTLSAPVGVPALFGPGGDVALVGSTDTLALFAIRVSPALCNATDAAEVFTSSVAVAADGGSYAVTRALNGGATLRRYTEAVSGSASPKWAAAVGTNVVAPLALDGQSRALISSQDGTLVRATDQGASGSVLALSSLPAQAEASPVVLANDDVVIGLVGGSVYRLAGDGTSLWPSPPDVGGSVRGLAALQPGLDEVQFLVLTALGEMAALKSDGTIAWSGRPTTSALSFPTAMPGGANGLPTLYTGSQDGKLYAVVVDGQLDTTAPWPKAHHDVRNTGNAGSPLP